MIPYFALLISIAINVVILLSFGYIKNCTTFGTKRSAAYGAFQTLCVGALAAGGSYGIVRAVSSSDFGGDRGPAG